MNVTPHHLNEIGPRDNEGICWTLPTSAYTREDVFELEQQNVFRKAWRFVCHSSEVALPGQYVTTQFEKSPVMVIRDLDGTLRALSNVCRHRASLLLSGSGTCEKVITCPYHGATYRPDGHLLGMPEQKQFPKKARSHLDLPQFSLEVLNGLVFVSLEPNPEPLSSWFGVLGQNLAPFPLADLEVESITHGVMEQNWKVITDNYLEGYHVPLGHPGLMRLLNYKGYANIPGTRHVWMDAPLREKAPTTLQEHLYHRLLRPMPGYPASRERSWNYAWVWPNLFLDIYPDQVTLGQLSPLGLRKTAWEYRTLVPRIKHPLKRLQNGIVRTLNNHINLEVQQEDDVLCQRVQQGLDSQEYTRGILGGPEIGVEHFHQLLREAVPGIDSASHTSPTRSSSPIEA